MRLRIKAELASVPSIEVVVDNIIGSSVLVVSVYEIDIEPRSVHRGE